MRFSVCRFGLLRLSLESAVEDMKVDVVCFSGLVAIRICFTKCMESRNLFFSPATDQVVLVVNQVL